MKKETQPKSHDFTSVVRPMRGVFLVDAGANFNFLLNEVIPWFSTHWGGGYNFVFPIFNEGESHPSFEVFLKLVRKFDPDKIYSTGQFSQAILEKILDFTLMKDRHFQFSPTVPTPHMIGRGFDRFLPMETMLKTSNVTIDLKDYGLTGQSLLDLWFFSHYGRISPHSIPSPSLNIVQSTITPQNIEMNAKDIGQRSFDSNFRYSPMSSTFRFLGGALQCGWESDFDTPNLIIVGDSLANWALFQSLKNFYPSVYWICPNLLSQNNWPNGFDSLLFDSINDRDKVPEANIVSVDIPDSQLQAIVSGSLAKTQVASNGFKVIKDFNEAVHNWYEWAEINNTKDNALLFQGKRSSQRIQPMVPKYFKPAVGDAKFLMTLIPDSYCLLGHPDAKNPFIEWPNSNIYGLRGTKRALKGKITFDPISVMTFGSQDLDSVIGTPRVVLCDLLDDFNAILKKHGYIAKRTIKSLNVQSVLALWGGDSKRFVDDFYVNDTSKIFEVYRIPKAPTVQLGITNYAGVKISEKFFFSYPIKNAFSVPLATFEDDTFNHWVTSKILVRGEKLVCQTCGYPAFYDEAEYNRDFNCKRCKSIWARDLSTMGAPEPRFLYALNPLVYGLFDNSSQLTILGIQKLKELSQTYFEFESELEIYEEGAQNPFMEIDIVANVDGRVILGECKVGSALTGPQLQSYVSFCKKIRTDGFACVAGSNWPPQRLTHIKQQFAGQPFTFETFFLNP